MEPGLFFLLPKDEAAVLHSPPEMDLSQLHHLGRLGKPWGHRGELVFHLGDTELEEVLELGVLFAELDGLRVPFHVSHLREHPRVGAVVKFEDIDDPQSGSFLVNCEVYAPPGHIPPELEQQEDEENLNPEDLIGMLVLDENYGELGEITGTEGTEAHPVMVVRKGEQEILIPMVDDMITGIDFDTGHLVVRTPPGLVDLYRSM
jgi:16S rRNA processing protein RimM